MHKRSQQKARRHLATITDSQVEAMRAADPDALADAVGLIRAISSDDDVREHATIIVASLIPGADSVRHAARAACTIATRAVALSRSLGEEDLYGDMTEEVTTTLEHSDARGTLTRYAPDPAAAYRVTYGDLLQTLLSMVSAIMRPTLLALLVAYIGHARGCTHCTGADTHRVTLRGIPAHVLGLTASSAEARRMATRADHLTHGLTLARLLARIDDPAPMAPSHVPHARVSLGECAPSSLTYLTPVRTITTPVRVTTAHVATVTRVRKAPVERDAWERETRRAARAHAAAVTESLAHARRTLSALGIVGSGYVRPMPLDVNGYPVRLGYAPPAVDVDGPLARLLTAERAAIVTRPDRVTTEERVTTVRTTTATGPRGMTEAEVTALGHPGEERGARHAGEEYGPSSAPNLRDLNDDGTLRAFPTVVSPRKKAGTGSTGPTVRAF